MSKKNDIPQYTLFKIPIKILIDNDYDLKIDIKSAIEDGVLIKQTDSLLFDQIERLRGYKSEHISELILLEAKKNKKTADNLKYILGNGFIVNGHHYQRFGKSAAQGKAGITAFVVDDIFDELMQISKMDMDVKSCVISKYESQRCLIFSACTLIKDYMPRIVIIGEYEKQLKDQLIKYVVERKREYHNKETGKSGTYTSREIEEGRRDIDLSPFDGCGCHEFEFTHTISEQIGLDYDAIGAQVRLPGMKGYSVYVPFRQILHEWGYDTITDIYGQVHDIDDVDCIWNISMFKWHKMFKGAYGDQAWNKYMETLIKYQFKLGISKYSHHTKDLNKKARMNFQYLQCLDLWNPKYIDHFLDKEHKKYDILASENEGKMIQVAKYTTHLFEHIIKGDKFYTYKFMGILDDNDYPADSIYLQACMINDVMLKDPMIKKYIHRKLIKYIKDAKLGKIFADGFYHTIVGDMIGYLQYATGQKPVGCLKAGEFYTETLPKGKILSFRSPLVDSSEVNAVELVSNDITRQWFSYFKDQDVAMVNMYDLSLPQQGGADCDGDAVFLCCEPTIIQSKIDKPIIIDVADKVTTSEKEYNKENIIQYEMMTRDNRIGEITNVATSIENKFTSSEKMKKKYEDDSSLLRIFQGKEIDFLKTGFRWNMNRALRKHLEQLPWFLLYNYPKKLKRYDRDRKKNWDVDNPEDRVELCGYRSPSPMNELCDYINTWELKHIYNNKDCMDTRCLILNNEIDVSDRAVRREVRHVVSDYAKDFRELLKEKDKLKCDFDKSKIDVLLNRYVDRVNAILPEDPDLIANYVISVSYSNMSTNKSLAWHGFGEYILKNLTANSNPQKNIKIEEVPYETNETYEYLGKFYVLKGCDKDV